MNMVLNKTTPIRDRYREARFSSAYGYDPKIYYTRVTDGNGDYVEVKLQFKFKDKELVLIETYNDGKDNSTRSVLFVYDDNSQVFDNFNDGEQEVVKAIRELSDG